MKADHCRPRGLLPWDSEEDLGSLVKLVSSARRRQIEKALRPLGLTPQQGLSLQILMHTPGSTHSDLEWILCIEKPSVTSLVNGLEKRGWVVRRQHPEDARIKQIFLTDSGEALAVRAKATVNSLKAGLNAALSEEERSTLKELLKKTSKAWEDMDQGYGSCP